MSILHATPGNLYVDLGFQIVTPVQGSNACRLGTNLMSGNAALDIVGAGSGNTRAVTLWDNVYVPGDLVVSGNTSASGASLTNLNASAITTGTLANPRLPSAIDISTVNANSSVTTTTATASGNVNAAQLAVSGLAYIGGALTASGGTTTNLAGNVAATGNITTTANVTASYGGGFGFFGNGRNITSLTATNVDSGTLDNARLPTNVNIAGTLNANGATTLATATASGNVNAAQLAVSGNTYIGGTLTVAANVTTTANVTASSGVGLGFFGNGRNVTSLSATNVDSGTLANARLPTTITGIMSLTSTALVGDHTGNTTATGNLTTTANVTASSGVGLGFFGNGRNVTGLSATNVDSGTLNNARLPTNVNVAGTLNANGATTLVDATLTGNLQMSSQKQIRLYSTTTYIDSVNDNAMGFFASGATSGVFSFTPKGVVALTIGGDGTNTDTTIVGNLVNANGNVTASSALGRGFFGNGRNVTALSATNVDSGTLNNARLPTNVNVAGTLNANGATTLATATMSGNVNAAQLAVSGISYIGGVLTASAGTTTNVTGNLTATGNITTTANVTASSGVGLGFFGNGRNVTSLSATNVDTGTLSNARLPTNVDVSGTLNANGTVTFSDNVTMNNGKLLTLSNTGLGLQYLDTFANNTLRLFSYGPSNGGQITFSANVAEVGRFNADGLTVTGNAGVSKSLTATSNVNAAQLSVSGTGYVNNLVGSNVALTGCVSAYALTASPGQPVLIAPNQSEKMRVDVNGNVGIGNSAAVHSLSVNGNAYSSGDLALAGNVLLQQLRRLQMDTAQYLDTNSGNKLRLWSDGPTNSGVIELWANGYPVASFVSDGLSVTGNASVSKTMTAATFSGSGASLTALAAGQVSTGQLNNARLPSAISVATSLQANSTITLSGTSTSNLYNDAGVLFTRYAAGQSSSTDYFISRGGTTPYAFGNVLLIHTPSAVTDAAVVIGTSGGVVRMKVDSVTGNVGIGNSAPAHNLAVNGTAYVSGQLLASNHSVTGTTTYLSAAGLSVLATNPDSTQYGMVGMLQRTNAGNVGLTFSQAGVSSYGILHPLGGGLTFVDNRWPGNLGSGGAGGAGTEYMRIAPSTGYVGIANAAPAHNLAVNGTAYVSGAVYSTGNVRIGSATAAPYQLDLTADTARKLTTSTWATGSDARVKSNVEYANLDVCYDVVKAVPLRRFEWDAAQYPDVQDRTVVGWIAQEVEAIFPKAVSSSSERGFDDFRTLSVDQLYKTMYGALQKVIAVQEMLEARVVDMSTRVAALEN